jgi:arylsulfatase A-like enzyme
LVSNLDFAETFLEAAGVPIPAEMQGKSLVPILKGEQPADWRKSFYYEYYEYPEPHRVRPHHGVVTDRYKLVRFQSPEFDDWELFDLKTDPREMKNVIGDPAYKTTLAELRVEMTRLRRELKVPDAPPKEAYGTSRNPAATKKKPAAR